MLGIISHWNVSSSAFLPGGLVPKCRNLVGEFNADASGS